MITQGELKRVLRYNKVSGFFTWLVKRPGGVVIGDRAGKRRYDGYVVINIKNRPLTLIFGIVILLISCNQKENKNEAQQRVKIIRVLVLRPRVLCIMQSL